MKPSLLAVNSTASTITAPTGPSSCLKLQTSGGIVTPGGFTTVKHQISVPNFVFPFLSSGQTQKVVSIFYRDMKASETEQAQALPFVLTSCQRALPSDDKNVLPN